MDFEFNYITLIGSFAQILFFTRFAVQLFVSEKAKASLSPTLFWQISLIACYVMIIYGTLREDFSIIEGQLIGYFIYIRNLQLKGAWKQISPILRWIFLITPLLAIGYAVLNYEEVLLPLLKNPSVPLSLMLLGIIGQTIFVSRFVFQWVYSEYKKESVFPTIFWVISIIGSLLIIIYALYRWDLVLLVGSGFGFFVYSRNLYLRMLEKKNK